MQGERGLEPRSAAAPAVHDAHRKAPKAAWPAELSSGGCQRPPSTSSGAEGLCCRYLRCGSCWREGAHKGCGMGSGGTDGQRCAMDPAAVAGRGGSAP